MILLDKGFLSWKDYSNIFKLLKDGGMFIIGKYGISLKKTKTGSGFNAEIFVIGKELDHKVYFKDMTNTVVKKEVKKAKSSGGTTGGLLDGI